MSAPLEVGDTVELGGAAWRVVDLAPAYALAEMAAVVLDDEGFEVALFAVDPERGTLGPPDDPEAIAPAVVLVPQPDAERALAVLAREVEDFSGQDLEALLARLAAEGIDPAEVGLAAPGDDPNA